METETGLGQTLRIKPIIAKYIMAFGVTLLFAGLFIIIVSPANLQIFSWRITKSFELVGTVVALVGLVLTVAGWLSKAGEKNGRRN